MVQHGLKKVKTIIKNVHDTVDYINGSEYRLKKFAELVGQFNIKHRMLVLECKTRWNSTYDMLACAIKFKEDNKLNSPDEFVSGMVKNMKERFDKYWGECNLLMAIGCVLDPRLKMKGIEVTFPDMFPVEVVRDNIRKVRETLYELYDEYNNNVGQANEIILPIP
ncbi:DAYSLEEPER [Hibiscus trionum]|uniref:DAYSLEEPER n=1 Tax=Hibiscus trionum TaxID=183268 RepID=A0A9W7JDE1_HIBTR|nr:DAYSLEEPER [Hibiscus trionum]